jgi:CRISPR/Cas system CSM-associated protein Csm4 (group 5 of RAMP superfamily)
MIQEKISLILKDLAKAKNELLEINKSIKKMEKIETEEFVQLDRAYRELRQQVKDYKENFIKELQEDSDYNSLRETRLKHEEDIANTNAKLFELLDQLPPKAHEMRLDTEEGFFNVNILPEMKIYLNGKEERRRVI